MAQPGGLRGIGRFLTPRGYPHSPIPRKRAPVRHRPAADPRADAMGPGRLLALTGKGVGEGGQCVRRVLHAPGMVGGEAGASWVSGNCFPPETGRGRPGATGAVTTCRAALRRGWRNNLSEQNSPPSPGHRPPPYLALPSEPTRAAKRWHNPSSIPQGGAWAPADSHLSQHNPRSNRAATPGRGRSAERTTDFTEGRRAWDPGASWAPPPEDAGEPGGPHCRVTPEGQGQTYQAAPACPAAPP